MLCIRVSPLSQGRRELEEKAFFKLFIQTIWVDGDKVTVNYKPPLPDKSKDELALSVLPIDTLGGPCVSWYNSDG
jgi:hypothetical protein